MSSAPLINLFTAPEVASDPVLLAKLTAESIASLAAARIESGDLSADLASKLQEISQQLAAAESLNRLTEAELAARAKALEREAETLTQLRRDFETSRDEWQASQEQLIKSQKQWTDQVQKQNQFLQQRLDQLESCHLQLTQMQLTQTPGASASSAGSEAALVGSVLGSRVSRQREAQLEAMLHNAEDRESELLGENKELEAKIESLTRELEKALGTGDERLMREDYTAMAEELKSAQRDAERLRQQLGRQDVELFQKYQEKESTYQKALEDAAKRVEELEAQRAMFEARLAESSSAEPLQATGSSELEEQAARYREEAAKLEEELDSFKRRYEMAMDDLQELKAENETLKQNLKTGAKPMAPSGSSKATHGAASVEVTAPLDWEEEKRRLVAMLDTDFQEDSSMSLGERAEIQTERAKIEDIIDQTDRVVQVKSHEIMELKALLQDQNIQVGNLAVGVGAFEAALGQDDIVNQERENLKRLQEELHEKLKKAEIDISLERAKVARERAEMDDMLDALGLTREKMREVALEARKKSAAEKAETHRLVNPKANKQTQWFDQMGIKESE